MINLEKTIPFTKLISVNWSISSKKEPGLFSAVHFEEGGLVRGIEMFGVQKWAMRNGDFRLLSDTDTEVLRLNELYVIDGGIHLNFSSYGSVVQEFTIRECTEDGHPGYGGPLGLSGPDFLFPKDLQVTQNDVQRVLLVGSCLTELYFRTFQEKIKHINFDYILYNSAGDLPEVPPHPISEYNFQYLQIPLRSVLPDSIITGNKIFDPTNLNQLHDHGCAVIDAMLDAGLTYNRKFGVLTFVSNFIVPQRDIVASIDKIHGDEDISFLVRKLNRYLAFALQEYKNVFLCDVDSVASSIGKRYFLDDITGFYTHGSNFIQDDIDMRPNARIEAVPHIQTFYASRQIEFILTVFEQSIAAYRTVKQIDQVKAVIFDLDNTLWRGLIAEDFHPDRAPWPRGGWQNGIWEAVQHLRARGILVAICSKNDYEVVDAHWDNVVDPPFLKLADFPVTKINWRPKSENVSEICREFNLTPKSVLFVDDNPVEREAVRTALPGIRTIGSNPYLTRRVLLWAPELQLPYQSSESALRETSIRSQALRDETRQKLSRDEFLLSLNCSVHFIDVLNEEQTEFPRLIELTNKTNQFNTTGKRWDHSEIVSFLKNGGQVTLFKVKDKFSEYGIVGALYFKDNEILQFVMSCRVLGMDIEKFALVFVVNSIRSCLQKSEITAYLTETSVNQPCRDVFERVGFQCTYSENGQKHFSLSGAETVHYPSHIVGKDHNSEAIIEPQSYLDTTAQDELPIDNSLTGGSLVSDSGQTFPMPSDRWTRRVLRFISKDKPPLK